MSNCSRRVSHLLVIGAVFGFAAAAAADPQDDNRIAKPADLISAMLKSSVNTVKAIAEAESRAKGTAIAMCVKMREKNATVVVHAAADAKCLVVSIDRVAHTTDSKEASAAAGEHPHVGDAAAIAKSMQSSKLTLAKVVEAASAASKGVVVSATPKLESGKLEFDVYSIVGDKLMKYTVDAIGTAKEAKEVDWATRKSEYLDDAAKPDEKEDKKEDKKKTEKGTEKTP